MKRQNESPHIFRSLAGGLQGALDAMDELEIVRRMLFLRYADAISLGNGVEMKKLQIPPRARWTHLAQLSRNLLREIKNACQDLERTNPELKGAFTSTDLVALEIWDSERQDQMLSQLIGRLSTLPDPSARDPAASIYDSLIMSFAEDAGKRLGEAFLPLPVADMMAAILDLGEPAPVYDPSCRAGEALAACARRAAREGHTLALSGQERSVRLCSTCRMNLLFHGVGDARVEAGDALHSPLLSVDGALIRYRRVIGVLPFSRDRWGAEDAARDTFGRFPLVPPRHLADYAYVLHCLSVLDQEGCAVVLTTRGVLFRGGSEQAIRKFLIEGDHLDAVIGLPGGLLYGTHIPTALLVLRREKRRHQGEVLFMDLPRMHEGRSRKAAFSESEIAEVASDVHDFRAIPGKSRVVHVHEIEKNDWGLNPTAYLPRPGQKPDVDLSERLQRLANMEREREEAVGRTDALVKELIRRFAL